VSENCQTSAGETQQGTSCAPLAGETFAAFVDTIAALRAPNGCPWDREQTHESIARNMIEEAYEAVDAIEQRDTTHLREELGDVLLQVVLQSQIAADAGEFTVADVCRDVNAKMIRRHPHVFGEAAAGSAEDVLSIWDNVKLAEKSAADAQTEEPEGLLDSVPASFPALLQAYKISRKAVAAGFEWDTVEDVWAKVEEEIAEFKQACRFDDAQAKELEFGDVLFSLVNVARKEGIDAETALRATCRKFRERWAFMEGAAWGQGKRIEELDMDEMQQLWDQAKMLHVGEASHD
jgi:tetrapyrrole methylase family protein/MazG family protein